MCQDKVKQNPSRPLGAQPLRLRQELEAIWPGSLAVPRQKDWRSRRFPSTKSSQSCTKPLPFAPQGLEGFCFFEGENLFFPPQSGPKGVLQLLRSRGGENPVKGRGPTGLFGPAKAPKRGTGWGPASGSLRVVGKRPAEGEQMFSFTPRIVK